MVKQETKLLALEYFGETDMNKPQKLVDFEKHLADQWPELLEHLPQHREDFLLKFLRGGNFDIEKSGQVKKTSHVYYVFLVTNMCNVSPGVEKLCQHDQEWTRVLFVGF